MMAIVLHLQGRRVTRAEDLAGHFEVSLRTIYRDVSALSEAGVPVVAEAGVGYSLMKGYYLPPIMFTEDEAAALGMAAMALSQASDPSLEASIRSALLKVRAALPLAQRHRLDRIENLVTFAAGRRCGGDDGGGAPLVDVQACLAEGRVARIDYRAGGRQEISSRIVEPLGLVRYLERWHLIAWCRLRGDYRDFRVDRIERLETLGEKAPLRDDFDMQDYLSRQGQRERPARVRIFFAEPSVDRAKREWSLGLADEERAEGGSILTLATGELDWMIGWLLSFCDRASVIDPPELRARLADEARRLTEHHARG